MAQTVYKVYKSSYEENDINFVEFYLRLNTRFSGGYAEEIHCEYGYCECTIPEDEEDMLLNEVSYNSITWIFEREKLYFDGSKLNLPDMGLFDYKDYKDLTITQLIEILIANTKDIE